MKILANIEITELSDNQLKEFIQECTIEMHTRLKSKPKVVKPVEVSKPNGRHWTTAEEEIIKQIYGRVTIKEIGSQLDRTERSVRYKLKKMGLMKNIKLKTPLPGKILVKRKFNKGSHAEWKQIQIKSSEKQEGDKIVG